MTDAGALSFAKDIRPLFTELDVAHMKPAGIDLSNRADVEAHADAIYRTVSEGSMPPASAGEVRWSPEMCDRFKKWREQGCRP
jgi:hypothetical protein